MEGPLEERIGGGLLHDLAEVHDGNPIGDLPDDREVVGDEQVCDAELGLELAEERQHAQLHRHVQARGDLVGDHQVRPEREGSRDGDALALTARELVRVPARRVPGQPDPVEEIPDHASMISRNVVNGEGLSDDRADPPSGIERGVGILEDDLHPPA